MKLLNILVLLASMAFLTSCYHAQITTGAQPSGQVIDNPWAHSFIFGLVPPSEVRTASECPNGVAKVETQISFLNGLVSAITFNIYTPMHITVACADGSGMSNLEEGMDNNLVVPAGADDKTVIDAIQSASEQAVKLNGPVFINFQ
jgi:hypothetical protein